MPKNPKVYNGPFEWSAEDRAAFESLRERIKSAENELQELAVERSPIRVGDRVKFWRHWRTVCEVRSWLEHTTKSPRINLHFSSGYIHVEEIDDWRPAARKGVGK